MPFLFVRPRRKSSLIAGDGEFVSVSYYPSRAVVGVAVIPGELRTHERDIMRSIKGIHRPNAPYMVRAAGDVGWHRKTISGTAGMTEGAVSNR